MLAMELTPIEHGERGVPGIIERLAAPQRRRW
jgi:hypothetical protein